MNSKTNKPPPSHSQTTRVEGSRNSGLNRSKQRRGIDSEWCRDDAQPHTEGRGKSWLKCRYRPPPISRAKNSWIKEKLMIEVLVRGKKPTGTCWHCELNDEYKTQKINPWQRLWKQTLWKDWKQVFLIKAPFEELTLWMTWDKAFQWRYSRL